MLPRIIRLSLRVLTLVGVMISLGCDQQLSKPRTRSVTYHALNKTHMMLSEVEIVGDHYPANATFGNLVQGGWARKSLPTGKLETKFQVVWKVGGEMKRKELVLPSGFDPEYSTTLSIEFREDGEVVATTRPQTDGLENYLRPATSTSAPASPQ